MLQRTKDEESSWVTALGHLPAHAVTCYSAIHKHAVVHLHPLLGFVCLVGRKSCPASPLRQAAPQPL